MSTKASPTPAPESANAVSVDNTLDVGTIGAIAVVAYALANILHEGLGHGGACLLMGGRPLTLNAIFFAYDYHTVSPAAVRVIAAAGGIVNLVTGLLGLVLLRRVNLRASSFRYFLWLFSAVSLLMAFGYILFSGVLGVGDWIPVMNGFGPPLVVRVALAAMGGLLYFVVAPKLLIPPLTRLLDPRAPLAPQVKRLMRLPYFVGGVTFVVAALFNPLGLKLLLMSAIAASFGGASFLVFQRVPAPAAMTDEDGNVPLVLKKSVAWMVAALLTAIIFIGVLGRGIRF